MPFWNNLEFFPSAYLSHNLVLHHNVGLRFLVAQKMQEWFDQHNKLFLKKMGPCHELHIYISSQLLRSFFTNTETDVWFQTPNILLTGELHAKLADFGCTKFQTVTGIRSTQFLPDGEENVMTFRYTAREVLQNPRKKKCSPARELHNFQKP